MYYYGAWDLEKFNWVSTQPAPKKKKICSLLQYFYGAWDIKNAICTRPPLKKKCLRLATIYVWCIEIRKKLNWHSTWLKKIFSVLSEVLYGTWCMKNSIGMTRPLSKKKIDYSTAMMHETYNFN